MRTLCIAILLALLALVSACGAAPTPQETLKSPLELPTAPTTSAFESAIPTKVTYPRPEVANPQPGKGSVEGQFVDSVSGEPLAGRIFYLAELSTLKAQDGDADSGFLVMMPQSSPSANTDQGGYFAFLNVEPKTYAIVSWTPTSSWPVTDSETQKEIVVTIKAGEITDLGTIRISTAR